MKEIGGRHFQPVFSLRYLNANIPQPILNHQVKKPVQSVPSSNNAKQRAVASSYPDIIYDGTDTCTAEEARNQIHVICPFRPPDRKWLLNTCKTFGLPFNFSIYTKAIPVDDVHYYDPDNVIKTAKDGHCGFHSLSTILTGTPNNHGTLRLMLARHILRHINRIQHLPFFEDAKAIAIADFGVNPNERTDCWMNNVHLAAAGDLFKLNILVRRPVRYGWNCYNSSYFYHGLKRAVFMPEYPSVLVDHQNTNHFEPVTSLKEIVL